MGNLLGVPVPGERLEKRGEGDKRELQSLAQVLGTNPPNSAPLAEPASSRPCQDAKDLNRRTAVQAARQPG